mmetsp:Transcript_22788/g.45188  ORF Transcript_22788/g.45188 Transcript_22788/m.45188 type:complete len:238 (+) Transcript_22788:290-1003(+)
MAKCNAVFPDAFWWLMSAPRFRANSMSFRLQFCALSKSRVLPFSSWESTGNSALRLSSTRFTLPLRAWLNTVSKSGTPSPVRAATDFSSCSTAAFLSISCSFKGLSLSRAINTLRTCNLCSIPSTWAKSCSLSSSKKSPSTDASRNASTYCPSVKVSSQRPTSITDHMRTSFGKGSWRLCLADSSAVRACASSISFFCSAASITSCAPSFRFFTAGMLAAAAAAAASLSSSRGRQHW